MRNKNEVEQEIVHFTRKAELILNEYVSTTNYLANLRDELNEIEREEERR